MNSFGASRFAVRLVLPAGGGGTEIYPGTPQYINDISYRVPDTAVGRWVVEATVL